VGQWHAFKNAMAIRGKQGWPVDRAPSVVLVHLLHFLLNAVVLNELSHHKVIKSAMAKAISCPRMTMSCDCYHTGGATPGPHSL